MHMIERNILIIISYAAYIHLYLVFIYLLLF